MDLSFDRRAFTDGVKTIAPLAVPGIPFGFILGFIIQDEGLPLFAGWSMSWIILAGSSQLAAVNLLAEGASAVVIVVTVFFINSRHAMYSAALRPKPWSCACATATARSRRARAACSPSCRPPAATAPRRSPC